MLIKRREFTVDDDDFAFAENTGNRDQITHHKDNERQGEENDKQV